MNKLILGAGLLTLGTIVWAAKDPVLMTVNGIDVPKSEFEYLYHKNSKQQAEPQSLDEYVEMFKLYKMKVADAKAAGIDTTQAFLSEMEIYRNDLAMPYVADSVYIKKLVKEAYDRAQLEAQANHIMILKGNNCAQNAAARAKIDSIRQALLGGADFEELAFNLSDDKSAKNNKGHLGYITASRFPYFFENEVFTLKPGKISEVIESPMAYHVVVGGEKRPARGSVRASHIMKMVPPGSSPEKESEAKAAIDSLYMIVVADPTQFETIARTSSDDPNSARMGGDLGWFSTGMMVPEFETPAYELEIGQISRPVRSPYGWHIIMKKDKRPAPGYNEVKTATLQRIGDPRDERVRLVRDRNNANLAKKHKGNIDSKTVATLKSYISQNGVDSLFYNLNANNAAKLFSVGNDITTVADFVNYNLNNQIYPDCYVGSNFFDDMLTNAYSQALMSAEEDWLESHNADYRNLMNEYRDGSLMYEISRQKVWDKAANDVEGLTSYFNAHKGDYKWSEPKAKGILIQAKDEATADIVKSRYAQLPKDSALYTLRKEFRNDMIADKVLAQKGVNKMVDYLMFEGAEPQANPKYPIFFMLDAKVLENPEEMNDVRGAVTTDYQNALEIEWAQQLKNLYPVVVNEDELRKVK